MEKLRQVDPVDQSIDSHQGCGIIILGDYGYGGFSLAYRKGELVSWNLVNSTGCTTQPAIFTGEYHEPQEFDRSHLCIVGRDTLRRLHTSHARSTNL
jgi:hypothetical protein